MPVLDSRPSQSTASKLLSSMRRISTTKRKQTDKHEESHNNVAERSPFPYTPSRSRTTPEPPSIEDIALGLHLSRTPHLRKPKPRRNVSLPNPLPASSPNNPRALPPPSALKNPSSPAVHTYMVTPKSTDSQSTSTLITTSPYVDSRPGSPKARLISRFFRLRASPPAAPSSSSSTAAEQDQRVEDAKVKKAVRFSSSALGLKDKAEEGR